jgi:hypothetical protein
VKLFRLAAVVVVVILLASITYFTESVASTDHHTAYCSQITNAATNYLSNPNLSRAEFTAANKSLVNVLDEGNKFPTVPDVTTMLVIQKAMDRHTFTADNYADFSKQTVASYLVANHC